MIEYINYIVATSKTLTPYIIIGGIVLGILAIIISFVTRPKKPNEPEQYPPEEHIEVKKEDIDVSATCVNEQKQAEQEHRNI